jgi:protein-disulfide isomerase
MLFVNGVELRGWDAPDAVKRALDAAREAVPANDGRSDRPPAAREKVLGDWRAEPARALPPDRFPRELGPADAPVVITLFGDYQDEFTVAADAAARALVLARDDVRYAFRHFPANQACNPVMEKTLHPLACLAALGAEMAATVQDQDGFWVMHDWLMGHREGFDDAVLLAQAKAMGIDEPLFWDVLKAPELGEPILDDVLAAKELGVESIPAIWVQGKRLARWKLDGEDLLPVVVGEALAK